MREIKFRAWDMRQKEMRSVMGFRVNKSKSITINATEHPENWEPLITSGIHKDGILMQYTGLKDKKGKEIYEGDIVFHSDKTIMEVLWSNKHATFIVKYIYLKEKVEDFIDLVKESEVIGNIYESPELLQKKEKVINNE